MWQKEKKDNGIINLALLFALTTSPMALVVSAPKLAQAETDTPTFALPEKVENGTTVRIDGSSTMAVFNQSLKQGFEQQFAGTKVEIAASGTEGAIKSVLDGKIDVAAIGRGLTPAEKEQGLEQVRLHREKIAIIVGEENPFKGSLTDRQFARIFRGRIKDWGEVGAPAAKIRVIDRPSTSDTREALNNYPVFKAAKFATGATATQVNDDNTAEIVKQLGKDGISYARANQVEKLSGVRILQLHDTSPQDPKYPFSQPLVYVFKKNPQPGVAAFVGYALAAPGQKAIETARVTEAEAIAKGEPQALLTVSNPQTTPSEVAQTTPAPIIAPVTESTQGNNTFPNAGTSENNSANSAVATPENPQLMGRSLLLWLLLPVGAITAIGGLVLSLRKRPAPALEGEPEATASETEVPSIPATETKPLVEINNHTNNGSSETPTSSPLAETPVLVSQAVKNTNNGSKNTVVIPPELEQSPWDMEAPAAVVNTSYSHRLEVSNNTHYAETQAANIAQETDEVNSQIPEEAPQSLADTPPQPETEDTSEIVDSLPDLPDFYEIFAEREQETSATTATAEVEESLPVTTPIDENTSEATATLPKFSEIPEDALNLVADAAEVNDDEPADQPENTNQLNLAAVGAGAAVAGVGAATWANINSIDEGETLALPTPTNTGEENLATSSETTVHSKDDEPSSIALRPRNGDWAYSSWYISRSDQQQLHNQGISQLQLRLYDVTDVDLSYQSPQAVQQDECEPGTTDHYLRIPTNDRNYIVEIGYPADQDQWVAIARSPIARVFNQLETDLSGLPGLDENSHVALTPRSPKWAYVNWSISSAHEKSLREAGISQLALRLYDATNIDLSYQNPQLVQQYEFDEVTRDRYVAIPHGDRDYVAEIGYGTTGGWVTIARSATVRIFNIPEGDFWFVADSELIIHGAAKPGATVSISGKPITVKPDGTFHLRVPFSGESLEYLISVASGEQKKTIHKKFSQQSEEG